MNPLPFDPTKRVQTRSGMPARILCTNRQGKEDNHKHPLPIIALVMTAGIEAVRVYMADGKCPQSPSGPESADLVNITTKRWRWVVNSGAYPSYHLVTSHYTRAEVDTCYGKESVVGHIPETELEQYA